MDQGGGSWSKEKLAEAQKRKETHISLSSEDWEIVTKEYAIWVSNAYLTPCICELVNKKYSGCGIYHMTEPL